MRCSFLLSSLRGDFKKLPNGFGTVYKIQHLLFLRRCSLRPVARLFFFLLLLWLRIRLIPHTLDILARAILAKRLETADTTFRDLKIVHNAFSFLYLQDNQHMGALLFLTRAPMLVLLIERGIVRVILCVQRRELTLNSAYNIRIPAHCGVKILRA